MKQRLSPARHCCPHCQAGPGQETLVPGCRAYLCPHCGGGYVLAKPSGWPQWLIAVGGLPCVIAAARIWHGYGVLTVWFSQLVGLLLLALCFKGRGVPVKTQIPGSCFADRAGEAMALSDVTAPALAQHAVWAQVQVLAPGSDAVRVYPLRPGDIPRTTQCLYVAATARLGQGSEYPALVKVYHDDGPLVAAWQQPERSLGLEIHCLFVAGQAIACDGSPPSVRALAQALAAQGLAQDGYPVRWQLQVNMAGESAPRSGEEWVWQ